MKSLFASKAGFWLFAALPVMFFFLYGFHGMDAADRGFIPAFSYRILSGEVIYQDFFYVRPPLTPYLHTFEMALFPDSLEMVAYRFFFYVFIWLSVLFSILALRRYFDFEQLGLSPWLMGSISFVLSIHNFFQAPWHTVDGILFAALGLFLLSRGPSLGSLVAGLLALGLSAMAKQPFAIVPLLGVLLVLFLYPWKRALVATTVALALALLCFLVIEYGLTPDHGFFQSMVAQTTGVTSFQEMLWSAFKLYIWPAAIAVLPPALVWWVLKRLVRKSLSGWIMGAFTFLGIAAVAIGPLVITLQAQHFVMPKSGFHHALLFCGGMVAILSFLRRDRAGLAVVIAMLAVSWASGVSWGYASPVLYSFPAIFALGYFMGKIAAFKPPRWFWPVMCGICIASVAWLNLYVYHEDFRTRITHDLGSVFPRLSHVRAGQEQFDRYVELKALHARYGDAFTVLPSMPAAHYLTQTRPRISADWVHDAEINYGKGIPLVIQQLEQADNYVFAMKDEMRRANESGTFRCSVLRHVIDHWDRIDSTHYFWVYAPPGSL